MPSRGSVKPIGRRDGRREPRRGDAERADALADAGGFRGRFLPINRKRTTPHNAPKTPRFFIGISGCSACGGMTPAGSAACPAVWSRCHGFGSLRFRPNNPRDARAPGGAVFGPGGGISSGSGCASRYGFSDFTGVGSSSCTGAARSTGSGCCSSALRAAGVSESSGSAVRSGRTSGVAETGPSAGPGAPVPSAPTAPLSGVRAPPSSPAFRNRSMLLV